MVERRLEGLGPHIGPILNTGRPLGDGLGAAILALQKKGVRPVSINSYLTCVGAYVNLAARRRLPKR